MELETINLFKYKCLKTLLKTVSKLTRLLHWQHKKESLQILLNFLVHYLQVKKEIISKLSYLILKKRLAHKQVIREHTKCLDHKSIKTKVAKKTATLEIIIGEVVRLLCK